MAERLAILDVPVDALGGIADTVAAIETMVESGSGCATVFAVNPEKVMAARRIPALAAALARASLLIPDGIGVVLAARCAGYRGIRRIPGIELMEALCARAAERGWPVFLLGARPEVNEAAARTLAARYPALGIAGRRDGFFADADDAAVVAAINASGARLLFVGLGSPKQELWLERHRAALQVRVCQGVGGSFDVLAGHMKRAPKLFRRLNLEWLYRLARDPRRISRQADVPRFLWALLWRTLTRSWRQ
jgi:N-acetylglucosaminyldiphosphoundecaprenol N-acetyl-beta-D-mannosaminyltransferase